MQSCNRRRPWDLPWRGMAAGSSTQATEASCVRGRPAVESSRSTRAVASAPAPTATPGQAAGDEPVPVLGVVAESQPHRGPAVMSEHLGIP
jgi:hypothetical protein